MHMIEDNIKTKQVSMDVELVCCLTEKKPFRLKIRLFSQCGNSCC